MIDEIRREMQVRLDALVEETDRLRAALAALGGPAPQRARARRAAKAPSSTTQRRAASNGRRRRSVTATAATATPSRRRTAGSPPAKANAETTNGANGSRSTGTKSAVIAALASSKRAMTAGEVATATGLGRASVSTTLSKLAKSGEVQKAARGYAVAR
jgi:CRP-like cAMP-binding protein